MDKSWWDWDHSGVIFTQSGASPGDTNMSFQIKAKNVFLTYPQCNLTEEEFHWAFWNAAFAQEITGYCIAQEDHADGGQHYHVVAHNPKSFRTRNPRYFDIADGARTYHGNYQACRDVRKTLDYVRKDELYSEDLGPLAAYGEKAGTWADVFKCSNYDEACEKVLYSYPRDWAISGERIRANLKYHFPDPAYTMPPPTYSANDFANVPNELTDWVENELLSDKPRKQSLILCGPTRTGKSSWARSLGVHLYQMSALTPSSLLEKGEEKYVILDDFEQQTIEKSQLGSCYKAIIGCQPFITLYDKYKPPKQIQWGIPCIWLCNNWPSFNDNDYVAANALKVLIDEPLY